jgi:hypothetical protein
VTGGVFILLQLLLQFFMDKIICNRCGWLMIPAGCKSGGGMLSGEHQGWQRSSPYKLRISMNGCSSGITAYAVLPTCAVMANLQKKAVT